MKNIFLNEKGSALLIAMIMLVVLFIIGTATMNTSTTEVMISGNYRTMKEAFYNTEGPLEYAWRQTDIYSTIGKTIGSTLAIPLAADNTTSLFLGKNVFSSMTSGNVTLRRIGNPPRGNEGTDTSKYDGYYYIVDVTGSGPANAESHQISEVVLLMPKDSGGSL